MKRDLKKPMDEKKIEPTGPLISIKNLEVKFINQDATVYAVNGVDIKLERGKVLTILGESGSGKSVTMRSILRLLPPKASLSGSIIVDGENVIEMSQDQLSDMRGRDVSMIFQEPMVAFDPVYKVGYQIAETVVRHLGTSFEDALARAKELFDLVQIPSAKSRLSAYPHELSGGMRQRAMIALALACSPKLLLADEPTTALDATVQIQILLLLRQLQRELGMSIIFVTHDVGVATEIADELAVMYAGKIVEIGDVADVIKKPAHPYTQGLLSSTVNSGSKGKRLEVIGGSPPDMSKLFKGCAFSPRCKKVLDQCWHQKPAPESLSTNQIASCFNI
ncbi:MAG: ABC transporter ATP-binding protein [Pseudomonadota bacterium]|jgi:peptide/nickel transport system ATP-binding protein|nr:ABC transporter ATP-binding protein [Pseudomonadota bacterium]|tara:strand:- start:162 stop:1166 length:1005 start_codon:yes stop_codon:yes gene_type:complete